MDDLGLVEAVDGFGESIVVRVADATHRRLDAGPRQAFGVSDGDVLAASIAVVHEPASLHGPPIMESLFQSVQDEAGMRRPAHPPADDPTGIGVDDKGDIDEAGPGRDVWVSRPKEFHLRPLSEPDVSLSAHPAPIIHPTTDSPSTNGRMRVADVAPAV